MYKQKRLWHPNEDIGYPYGFFNKSWAGRGHEYRMYVEPVDIANWCGISLARHPLAASRQLSAPLVQTHELADRRQLRSLTVRNIRSSSWH